MVGEGEAVIPVYRSAVSGQAVQHLLQRTEILPLPASGTTTHAFFPLFASRPFLRGARANAGLTDLDQHACTPGEAFPGDLLLFQKSRPRDQVTHVACQLILHPIVQSVKFFDL